MTQHGDLCTCPQTPAFQASLRLQERLGGQEIMELLGTPCFPSQEPPPLLTKGFDLSGIGIRGRDYRGLHFSSPRILKQDCPQPHEEKTSGVVFGATQQHQWVN
jgi:hypothetical protein